MKRLRNFFHSPKKSTFWAARLARSAARWEVCEVRGVCCEVCEAWEVCCEMWEVRDLQGLWKATSAPRGALRGESGEILAGLKRSSEVEFIHFVM